MRYSFSCRSVAGQRRRPEPLIYRTRLTASAKWERVGRWYRQFGERTTRAGETKRERKGGEMYEGLRGGGQP